MTSILETLRPPVGLAEPDAARLALSFLLDGLETVKDRCAGSMAEILEDFECELTLSDWPELEPDTAELVERVRFQLEAWTGTLTAASMR
jgi:hypothetical protein